MAVRPQRIAVCGTVFFAFTALACSDRMRSQPVPQITPVSHERVAPAAGAATAAPAAPAPAAPVSLPAELPEPMPRGDAFRRGIVLGPIVAPEDERAFKRSYARQLDRAAALGATDVELVVSWLQTDARAVELAPFDAVHDDQLAWLIDQAKRRKLRVQLSPVLEVEDGGAKAAAALKPSNWERWWWSYSRFVQHYARVAAMRKVPRLSLGRMLTSTEAQTASWQKLIKDVRKFYKGELMYVASADSFERIAFWEEVDVIGIAVDQVETNTDAELLAYFTQLPARIAASPVLAGHGYELHDVGCSADADTARTQRCRRALFQGFRDVELLHGVFMTPAEIEQEPSARSEVDVVAHWYRRSKG